MTCLLLFPVQLLLAQDEPTHSISELNTLLQKSKPDSDRVANLLEAALVYIMRPGEEKHDLDSAAILTDQAMHISDRLNIPVWQARCYRVYSHLYRESRQKEKGKGYIDRSIATFTKYDSKKDLADAYLELQRYYDIYSDSEWVYRVKYAEMAKDLYRQSRNPLKQAAVLKHLGDFYQIHEKDSIALAYLHEALAIYQSAQYSQVQGVYDLIGYILFNEGNYNEALKYGLLAVETAERLHTDSHELATIYNRIGLTYYRLARYREAKDYFVRSFSLALSNKDTVSARNIAPNAMDSYFRLGDQRELLVFLQSARFIYDKVSLSGRDIYLSNYIQAYLLNGNYKKAEPFAKELLRTVGDTSDAGLLRSLHRAIIPYYLAAGQYKEMYKYLPVNDSICRKYHIIAGLADNYLWWFKADSALGNYPVAIAHYKLYKDASDSLIRSVANRQINQLMIEYESLKKDQAIASKESNIRLLTDQAGLQQHQLRQTRLVKDLTFGLIALLLIIIGLLYNSYRHKQRTNKKLELQQHEINEKNDALQHVVDQKERLLSEKEWLLKEVHHRVKNNMQIVMSLLNTQSTYLEDDALTAIKESQHRMQAMSLIHQKLYQADNVAAINMPSYIRELTGYLNDSYDMGRHVQYNLDIEEIELDVSQAVPVGLILNEAITNAIKYAFPGEHKGAIDIVMKKVSGSRVMLGIGDNGIGLPSGNVAGEQHSFGISLIRGLVTQLEGSINIMSGKGLCLQIEFPFHTAMKAAETNVTITTT